MKIQLQSLHVVNCGPLRDVCIQFNTNDDSPVTVLAGANGSGKTTILELCASLIELFDRNSIMWSRDADKNSESRVLNRTDYAQLDFTLDNLSSSVGYSRAEPEALNATADWKVYRMTNKNIGARANASNVTQKLLSTIEYITHPRNQININFTTPSITNEVDLPSILFFPHTRSLVPLNGSQIQREETQYKWVYRFESVRSFAGSLDSYLIWLDYADPEIYAQVIDFLNSLDFDGKKFGVQRKELRAIVTTRDGQTHGVAELSSGEQNILIMLLELRRRLLPYSIVLIDEIENSLHAAFQHRLAQGLKRLQEMVPFQLIVTTHSSLFGRVFGPESVRILTEF